MLAIKCKHFITEMLLFYFLNAVLNKLCRNMLVGIYRSPVFNREKHLESGSGKLHLVWWLFPSFYDGGFRFVLLFILVNGGAICYVSKYYESILLAEDRSPFYTQIC